MRNGAANLVAKGADTVRGPRDDLPTSVATGQTAAGARDLVAEALDRIARDDDELRAWVVVDAGAATRAGSNAPDGPLAGVPFGVKDVIDVAGLPTARGLSWASEPALCDAWAVAALRARGAVPLGKTATTPLAFRDPAPTLHPHFPARTPGGSSSGSAAAVAAGHVRFALGTQTIGSILRPASFCGIVGFKPTYGRIPTSGVGALAPSTDTVGVLAGGVATAAAVTAIWLQEDEGELGAPPRLGFAADAFADRFGPEVGPVLRDAVERLIAAGADVHRATLPRAVEESVEPLLTVVAFEANAVLGPLRERGLPPAIDRLVADGAAMPYDAYRGALAFRTATRAAVYHALESVDALLLAVADPAPDRGSTGDPMPLGPWTFYGCPAVSLPAARSADGRPIGLQLVAAPGRDRALLATARWVEAAFRAHGERVR